MHLHLHSWYSFLAGTLSIDRIIAHGREKGARALALTDINNVSGVTEFYSKARAAGIKPIIGVELRAGRSMAVVLARDAQGYREICEAVTALAVHCPPARIAVSDQPPPVPTEEGEDHGSTNVLAELIPEHLSDHVILLSRDVDLLGRLSASGAAPSLYAELTRAHEASWPGLLDFAESHGIPLVATNDVYFGEPGGHKLHGILRAISTNKTLGTLDRGELAHPSGYFIGEQTFRERFRGIHFYDGHIHGDDAVDRRSMAFEAYDRLMGLLGRLDREGLTVGEVITSGTPSFLYALAYEPFGESGAPIHRVSPGTVVFHDLRSEQEIEDLDLLPAAVVLSRVVSHPAADIVTCDAGSKSIAAEAGDPCAFAVGHPELEALTPSEEHLPFRVHARARPERGSILLLVPTHVCPTVNLAEEALLIDEGRFVGAVPVRARGHDLLVDS